MKLNVNLGLIFFLSGSNVRENCCTFINDTPFELMLDWHVKWKLERKHSSWLISVEMAFLVVRLTLTTHRIGRSNGGQRLNLTWVRLSLFNGLGLRGRFSPGQRCRRHLMTCSLALNCHCLENAENESNSKKNPKSSSRFWMHKKQKQNGWANHEIPFYFVRAIFISTENIRIWFTFKFSIGSTYILNKI